MKKAFTLIELLVVIAIIAILAAILFPVFAQAKKAAKKSSDLSNIKQLSIGMHIYTSDYDDVLPSAYYHRAWSPASGGTAAGYIHWSYMIQPYVKNEQIFVSPGDAIGGHAPTCFASANNNKGKGWPSGQQADRCAAGDPRVPADAIAGGFIMDYQVPRLSYTVNSALIPRMRNSLDAAAGVHTVSITTVDSPAGTIMITGLTDQLECLNGQSLGTGIRNSSHRSTNGVTRNAANTQQYLGENTDAASTPLYALNYNQITNPVNIFTACKTNPAGTYPLITYHSALRWNEGDNYGTADGSAKFRKFAQTLNVSSYMWGKSMYTVSGQQVLDPISGLQVNQ
ncbi:MAG: prepilin-type N-terminal cleavage/methylation domain-containing protein [Chlorobia bacterium]|nr:prepilin-type N-terminal cleavage/methylation domain-containing protein [Fimbriimonadaceae bacterium]